MNSASLVLVDLDKTLIDGTYKLNTDIAPLQRAITRVQSHGGLVGLFSDSAMPTLEKYATEFGMHGPIIAERGAIMRTYTKNGNHDTISRPEFFKQKQNTMLLLRDKLVSKLSTDCHTLLVIGDVIALSQQKNPVAYTPKSFVTRVILLNSLRQHSISFYVRTAGGFCEQEFTAHTVAELEEIVGEKSLSKYWFDVNNECGICIMHYAETSKPGAVSAIKNAFPQRQIYMIGDSMSDFLDSEDVIQCAVDNAAHAYQDRCQLHSRNDLTRGVIDLLEQIATQSGF